MVTSPDYLAFILDLCHHDPDVTSRAMMGEYLIYYQGKLVGGLYDNRLLVKPVPAALSYLAKEANVLPYPGAKPMIEVEDLEQSGYVLALFEAMWPELPAPKPKKKSKEDKT